MRVLSASAAGAPTRTASRHATRAVRSIEKATLAVVLWPSGACGGQCAAHPSGPRGVVVGAHSVARPRHPDGPAARGRRAGGAARGRGRPRPRRDDQAGRSCSIRPPAAAPTASVAITGTPWLKASLTTSPHGSQEVARGDRRYDDNVAARVEVAQSPARRAPTSMAALVAAARARIGPPPTRTSAATGTTAPKNARPAGAPPDPFPAPIGREHRLEIGMPDRLRPVPPRTRCRRSGAPRRPARAAPLVRT